MPGLLLSLALGVLAAGASARTGEEPDIRELLQAIADRVSSSAYQGDSAANQLSAELAELQDEAPSAASARLLRALGVAEMRIGREREAIEHLEAAYAHLPAEAPANERGQLLRDLAVACLRLAETENCCQQGSPESCIVPLRGNAIHRRTAGSTQAIAHLTRLLEVAPMDSPEWPLGVWLLNLAYMTLDRYPSDVPAEHRIDPKRFRSSVEFPAFPNIAGKLGVDNFSLAGGVVVDDLDLDGDFDILTSTNDITGELRLYLSNGRGAFRECHEAAGLSGLYGGLNLVHADYDDDGDPDILVLRGAWLRDRGRHPNSLLRNEGVDEHGQLRFTDVTFAEGLGAPHYPTQTAGWADYDNDGDLDLYVGNESRPQQPAPSQLFENSGAPTTDDAPRFVDVAAAAGVANLRYAKGVSWGDYDADGDPDLYVSNFGGENRLYRNSGDGTFVDVAPELEVHRPLTSFPAWFWDYDNDGALDLFVSNYQRAEVVAAHYRGARLPNSTHPRLLRNRGDGTFEDAGAAAGLDRPMTAMGCNFGDLDNDGFPDFYLGTGHPDLASIVPNLMFWNRGGRRFVDVSMAGGFGHLQKGHAIAFADFDGDGDQDVFEQMGGAYQGDAYRDALFENPGFGNHWVGLQLVGRASNRSAVGARIAVTTEDADGTQRTVHRHVGTGASFGSSPLEQHIGLGRARRIVRIAVHWPTSGERQDFEDVPRDRRLVITEGAAGYEIRPRFDAEQTRPR